MPNLNYKSQITKLLKFVIFVLLGICFLKFGALASAQTPTCTCAYNPLTGNIDIIKACVGKFTATCTGSNLTNNIGCKCTPLIGPPPSGTPVPAPGSSNQGPIPSPAPIPCSNTGNPEFHSLRPYQASPCTVTPDNYAKFCGNDLTLHDTITEYYPGGGTCVPSGGKITCTYNQTVSKSITIDLTGATLPFMGNTEDVKNSQSSTDSLNAADKMNGYVSWYLNGVENRAENGSSENTDTNVVNFSGPLNKLLPRAIADAQRIQTIVNASGSNSCVKRNPNACNQKVCAANGTSYCCPDSAACTQLQNASPKNHDQIVVCVKSNLGILGDITGLGSFTAKECYQGNGSSAQGPIFRLSRSGCTGPGECDGWDGELSWWNDLKDAIAKAIASFFPDKTHDWIISAIGNPWNKRTPPLPWADENGKPFATEDLYTKAYNEWRGNTCVLIPVINKVVCFDDILVPDKYADLYSYIPLSSTEDLKGSISIDSVSSATSPTTGGVTVSGVTFSKQTPSTLFFPHMQESSELASLLQDTFVASGETKNKTASPTNTSTAPVCNTVEVRSNKGDKLFATQLTGTLNYSASFSCVFDDPSACLGQACGSCCPGASCNPYLKICQQQLQSCTKDVYVSLSTTGSIPKADNLWSQLVAGPESIFKRIFPKTNTKGSVGTIMDIPGSTNITYSGSDISQSTADLKFPHIGGISEYFLKGIQTALRPKGYGEPVTFGESSPQNLCASKSMPTLPGATDTSCKVCNYSISPLFQKIIESAAQTFNVPASVLLGTMQHEGAFNPGNDWNDANVEAWSICGGSFPGCNKDDMNNAQRPFGFIPYYFYADANLWGAVTRVDPSRTKDTVSPCNILDGTYAMAAALSMWSGGLATSVKFPISQDPSQTYSRFPDICYTWNLNNGTGPAGSCGTWNANTVATSQVGYGGWCPEPGKHPIQPYFPDGSWWIDSVVNYANKYTCK